MRSLLLVTLAATAELSAAVCTICMSGNYICGGSCGCNPNNPTFGCTDGQPIMCSYESGRRLENVEHPRRLADVCVGLKYAGREPQNELTACTAVALISTAAAAQI